MNDGFAIFAAIDTLVLERRWARTFRCLGSPPAWCSELWPACQRDADELAPEPEFPFLEVFLNEAEQAWTTRSRIDSETWTRVDEKGNEVHLQASAFCVDGHELLLLSRCDALHAARQMLLQRARELRLAHELAARAAEQKDVLVHCIINDLQAPLSTILGSVSRLHDEARSPTVTRLASTALEAAQKQRELILDILQLFTGEASAPGTTELVSTISAAAELFEPIARARGQLVQFVPGAGSVNVVGERQRLERVIANVIETALRNALTTVTIELQQHANETRVTIDDDGPPLPPEVGSSLFSKLGKSGDDGARLGLYFCRITLERWGGSIGYEARRDGGTRFWLRLVTAS